MAVGKIDPLRTNNKLQGSSTGNAWGMSATLLVEIIELHVKERMMSKEYQWTVGLI